VKSVENFLSCVGVTYSGPWIGHNVVKIKFSKIGSAMRSAILKKYARFTMIYFHQCMLKIHINDCRFYTLMLILLAWCCEIHILEHIQ
jgi:hypothetical protein